MSDKDLHDEDGTYASGGTLGGKHLFVIAAIAVIAGGFLYYWFFMDRTGEPEPVRPGVVTTVPEGSRTVTLYFADIEESALVAETRNVAIGREFVKQIEQVIDALVAGPEHEAVNTLPEGTKLLNVFYDSEAAVLFLDFSSELVAGHPGGAAAEYYTISAILKTVSENFPEIVAVQILVEGSQVGTIAGHLNAYRPFLVRDWR
jgi:spore germination protein GerM